MKKILTKICNSLGENNDAVYAVLAIAVAKGISRPFFTMMDKDKDINTRKYTATREGLTEAIAVPSYLAMAKLSKSLAGYITNHVEEKSKLAAKSLSFVGVCVTAFFIIPAICSVAIKPVMKMIHGDKNDPKKNNIGYIPPTRNVLNKPSALIQSTPYKPLMPPLTRIGGM